jgi:hypothetical protein
MNTFAIDGFSHVRVEVTGSDQKVGFCDNFRLSSRQAKKALRKARMITPVEYLENYIYLPCFVKGSAYFEGNTIKWTIRGGGNISILKSDGSELYLGCDSCKKSFGKNHF